VDQVEPTVEDAIALAARLHRGARYPSPEAEPYVFHALRVMLQFADPADQMAAVLHDVVEDTEFTLDNLRDAGYRPEVVDAIDALTHHSHDSYEQYIESVARNPVARRVKIIDLEENLANNRRSPLAQGNDDRIRRYEAALDRLRITQAEAVVDGRESESECGFH
jgi:(p)ppGpp synthase/HD superfamily hydrolase